MAHLELGKGLLLLINFLYHAIENAQRLSLLLSCGLLLQGLGHVDANLSLEELGGQSQPDNQ